MGHAAPANIRPNSEILKAFPNRTEEEMVRLTGIKERRHAAEDESATDLAAIAVQHALAQAGMGVEAIDGVIMATIIPDQPVPSMASALARRLGIPRALAFDLNAACSGWLYALEVGRSLILSGSARNVLVVTAELLLVTTILTLGIITGMVKLRDQAVAELSDAGSAIGSINQSYSVQGTNWTNDAAEIANVSGFGYDDSVDDGGAGEVGGDGYTVEYNSAPTTSTRDSGAGEAGLQ